jgi:exosortase/archaeosortase family protein
MRTELNARIGRTMPSPMFGLLVDAKHASETGQQALRTPFALHGVPRAHWLLAALLAALWPHWVYVARRLTDGSDEPWGILALVTVIVLLARDHHQLRLPSRSALVTSAALAVLAALASLVLPDLAAAAIAMLALGVYLAHALRRPATALIALLLLALPIIASLQFYVGYPLRVLTGTAATWLLAAVGIDASAAGASILWNGRTILIDAPCAGIGMLWVGSYTAALLSWLNCADARRTLINAAVAAALVLAANILRNTVLFFPEAGLVHWPAWSHPVIGLAAFGAAVIPIVALTSWKSK